MQHLWSHTDVPFSRRETAYCLEDDGIVTRTCQFVRQPSQAATRLVGRFVARVPRETRDGEGKSKDKGKDYAINESAQPAEL